MAWPSVLDLKRKVDQYLHIQSPLWRYAPLQSGESASDKRPSMNARSCLASKSFWRILFLVLGLLLLSRLLISDKARQYLDEYGIERLQRVLRPNSIDWSQFAYGQYASDGDGLCNSMMIFESLKRVHSRADRIMLYPRTWNLTSEDPDEVKRNDLLSRASNGYRIKHVPVDVEHFGDGAGAAAPEGIAKLLAFNQTQYRRVLWLDPEGTLLKPTDELFVLPSSPIALPRDYLAPDGRLSSHLLLVQPSAAEFLRITAIATETGPARSDTEIIEELYGHHCLVIPHRKYDFPTSEFRRRDDSHRAYLGNDKENWSAAGVLNETKFLHYDDWPMPKPWKQHTVLQWQDAMPDCISRPDGGEDCDDRESWKWAYEDYRKRREYVCGKEFMPSPRGGL